MRILLASSEVYPFSKTGGLADAVGALGKALAKAGHPVGIITPLYRGLRERFPKLQKADWQFDLLLGLKRVGAELWTLEVAEGLTLYFIHQPAYFDRAGLYGDNGADYGDNAERFIFFDKCVAHLARFLPWRPEVLHVHDWHTGLVPMLVAHQARAEGWTQPPKICLTIHNLAYQGCFPRSNFALTNLPGNLFTPETAEFYGQLNCLKAGIAGAEVITTVSPRYAREITTQEFGAGLDGLLRKRQSALVGILNGVDYEEWHTTANPYLPAGYSAANLAGKVECKRALQAEFALAVNPTVPVFGCVTRLADQKGMDLALGALEEMLAAEMQFVLLGSGAAECERAFQALAQRFPGQVGVRLGYDQALAHRIEAGSDFYLMPSRFEPCGLNQMYSLRYGTIPIVRRTGGLDDTIVDAVEDPAAANGIKFSDCSAHALARAMRKALALYQDAALLAQYRQCGMAAEFSWDQVVKQYLAVYRPS
ncbi:MAG: glycogen synthase GlgA [Verrucomicrobia subdivision 3 bacterium]|nr:glycogen synthase GlgA [Limisphaerales bacterium]